MVYEDGSEVMIDGILLQDDVFSAYIQFKKKDSDDRYTMVVALDRIRMEVITT